MFDSAFTKICISQNNKNGVINSELYYILNIDKKYKTFCALIILCYNPHFEGVKEFYGKKMVNMG